MSSPHLSRDDAEHYVLGALTPEAAEALERHTLACALCARLLQQEALLEEQLREVVRIPSPEASAVRPLRARRVRASTLGGLAAAIAAALLVLVLRPGHPALEHVPAGDVPELALPASPSPASARLVACPDPASQEACIEEARERGLLVQYPPEAGDVPRYEGYAGVQRSLAAEPASL